MHRLVFRLLLVFCFTVAHNSIIANHPDSLKINLLRLELQAKNRHDTAQICTILLQLAEYYEERGQYRESEKQTLKQLELAKRAKLYKQIGLGLNTLSSLYTAKGKIKEAHALQKKAHRLLDKYHNSKEKGISFFNLGVDAYALGEYEQAHLYFTSAISQFQETRDTGMIGETYRQMAEMYVELKQTEKAEFYIKKYQSTCLDNSAKTAGTFYQLCAQVQEQKGSFDSALVNYKKAISCFKQINDPFLIDWANYNLCHNLLQMHQYDQVIANINKLLPHFASMHATISVSFYPLLGIAWSRKNPANFQLAEQYLKQGLALAKEYSLSTEVQYIYGQLANMYRLKRDFKNALHYADLENQLKDSLLSEENARLLNELEIKFQTKEQNQQIELLRKEKTIALLQSNKQLQQRNYLLLGIGLLLVALVTAGFAYAKTRKYNRILAEEEQRKELLLQEVHHRTNNSLQLISALLTMQSYQVEDQKAKVFLKESESRIHSMSALNDLLHDNNQTSNLKVDIAEYLEKVINFHQNLSASPIEITSNVSSALFTAKIALPIALITNELITNAIKYAFEGISRRAHIHISLQKNTSDDQWLLSVSDNGIGLPPNIYVNGTGNIGSRLVRILTEQIDGTLKTNNNDGGEVLIYFNPNS